MNNLLSTIAIAFMLTLTAMALLAISWLLCGKLRLRPGACGRLPSTCTKLDSRRQQCSLCSKLPDESKSHEEPG